MRLPLTLRIPDWRGRTLYPLPAVTGLAVTTTDDTVSEFNSSGWSTLSPAANYFKRSSVDDVDASGDFYYDADNLTLYISKTGTFVGTTNTPDFSEIVAGDRFGLVSTNNPTYAGNHFAWGEVESITLAGEDDDYHTIVFTSDGVTETQANSIHQLILGTYSSGRQAFRWTASSVPVYDFSVSWDDMGEETEEASLASRTVTFADNPSSGESEISVDLDATGHLDSLIVHSSDGFFFSGAFSVGDTVRLKVSSTQYVEWEVSQVFSTSMFMLRSSKTETGDALEADDDVTIHKVLPGAVENLSGYHLEYRADGGAWVDPSQGSGLGTDENSYELSDLTAGSGGTEYEIRVRVHANSQKRKSKWTSVFAGDSRPRFSSGIASQLWSINTPITTLSAPSVSGGDGTLTYSATGLPTGLSVNASTGAITGTPSAESSGTVSLTVTDADGDTQTIQFSWVVEIPDTSPVMSAISDRTWGIGQAITAINPSVTGGNTPLTYGAAGLPDGISINASTGAITGTPTTAGTGTITVTVTDNDGDQSSQSFAYTVSADLMPTFGSSTISAKSWQRGEPVTAFTVPAASGGDGSLTYSASDLPAGVSFNTSTRRITGTPTSTGNGTVTITATDSDGDTATITFTYTIAAAHMPVVSAVRGDASGEIDLSWTDARSTTGGWDYRRKLSSAVSWGNWAWNGSGTGNPQRTIGSLTPGASYDFQVRSYGGGIIVLSNMATAIAESMPSWGSNDSGTALSLTTGIAMDDVTVPAATGGNAGVTYAADGLPAGVSFGTVSRILSGTPTTAGSGTITITATDDDGDTDTYTIAWTVVQGDETAPTLSSAEVSGTSLVLTYNEALNESSTPPTSAYLVQNGTATPTVNSVAVSGSTVTLTLATATEYGDTVTVTYNNASNPVQDTSGNTAASFVLQAVTNNNPEPDTTAPAFSSAAVNGATVTVVFDENLDTGSVPAATAFSVTNGSDTIGVSTVAISDATVTLTLASAVGYGDTPTLDYTAPTVSSAAVNGTSGSVTFNENLDTGSVPAASAFAITNGADSLTVSSVSISGATVSFTISSAIAFGDTPTLAYTAPSSNPLQDSSGNDVASFTGQAMTNNTPNPDTTAPTLSTATINADTLVLTYDENLDTESIPDDWSAWSVTIGGNSPTIIAVAMTGATVTLSLGASAVSGDTVTIDYTAPSANAIQDIAGNAAASFTGQSVTNNTPASAPSFTGTVSDRSWNQQEAITAVNMPLVAGGQGTLVYSASNLPAGLAISSSTGQITGTPTGSGTGTITVTVTDDNSATDTVTVGYTITADTTVPTLSSATVNEDELVLTYSEALDTGSVPATSDFTIGSSGTAPTVSSVAISGSTVTLDLSADVAPADTITITYVVPSTNPIQDLSGNDAAALTAQAVTNNTVAKAAITGSGTEASPWIIPSSRYNEEIPFADFPGYSGKTATDGYNTTDAVYFRGTTAIAGVHQMKIHRKSGFPSIWFNWQYSDDFSGSWDNQSDTVVSTEVTFSLDDTMDSQLTYWVAQGDSLYHESSRIELKAPKPPALGSPPATDPSYKAIVDGAGDRILDGAGDAIVDQGW